MNSIQNDKKHKYCTICNARLDKITRQLYTQVSKSELITKLRILKPDINIGDYICRKHSKQVERLPIDSKLTLSSMFSLILFNTRNCTFLFLR